MPDYRSRTIFYAQKHGIDPRIFQRQINQESGFNPNARSPAGALGIAQIVPKWHPGVNPMDPEAALDYAAGHMASLVKKYGNYKDALSVYNSGRPWKVGQTYGETSRYVANILSGANGAAMPAAAPSPAPAPAEQPAPGQDPMLQSMAGGLQALAGGTYNPTRALEDLRAAQAMMPPPSLEQPPGSTVPPVTSAPTGDTMKWVGEIQHRTGPSPAHGPEILSFVGRVGQMAGQKLTPIGNESHSIMTVNGNRSAHADGNAADIPSSGSELTRLGQTALVAAGMPLAQARKQKGGLFNIGKYQVIFQTQQGGDHTDHLHVGLRG